MKKISNVFDYLISSVEKNLKRHSLLKLFVIAYSFTLIRNFLESSFEEAARIGFVSSPFISLTTYFYHYPMYYFVVYLFVAIILTIGKSYNYKDSLKLSFFFAFWVLIAPLVDLIFGGHFDINYIMHSSEFWYFFLNSFNPFVKLRGATTGIRIESFLAIVAIFFVLHRKNKKPILNAILVLMLYLFILLTAGTLQSLFSEIFGMTFHQAFSSIGIIFYPALKMGLFLFIIFVLEAVFGLYLYDKKRFMQYLKVMRWERILFYISVVTLGLLIGLKSMAFGYPLIFRNPTDILVIFALFGHTFFGFLFGLIINDYYDLKGDILAGQKTQFTLRLVRKTEAIYLSIFYLLTSLVFAFSISYYTFLIALTAITLSYIYSVPPFRLKKYWPLSIYTITTIAFLEMLVGISVLGKYASINILPKEVFYVFFIILPLAFGTKDLKDYEGDKKSGVYTIFTIFGLETGCKLNAMMVFMAFMLVPLIYGKNFIVVSILLGIPVSVYIWLYPKLKHSKPRELIFFATLLFYILYMGKATLNRVKQPVNLQKLMKSLNLDYQSLIPHTLTDEKLVFDALMDKKDSFQLLLKAKSLRKTLPFLAFYYVNNFTAYMQRYTPIEFFDTEIYWKVKEYGVDYLIESDSIDMAIAYLLEGLTAGPYSDKFYLKLGKILMDRENFEGALEALKGAYFLHPGADKALQLSLAYKELGYRDSFIKYFNEYLKYKPK